MSGTKIGGARAADTNKKRHGADYYQRIGAIGGRKGRTGGFYANRELASEAGTLGGQISKRGPWTEEQKKAAARTRAHKSFQKGFTSPEPEEKAPTWADRLISKWGNR